jgi:hypothetical protein
MKISYKSEMEDYLQAYLGLAELVPGVALKPEMLAKCAGFNLSLYS